MQIGKWDVGITEQCAISVFTNTLAVGALFNDGNGTDARHVRIYDWNGSAWTQRGSDIDGEAINDQSSH